jgi:hypothetical protein
MSPPPDKPNPYRRGETRTDHLKPVEFGRCTCGGIVIYRGTGKPPLMCAACRVEARRERARRRHRRLNEAAP